MAIFTEIEYPQAHIDLQRPLNNQSNIEKEQQRWMIHILIFQNVLHSYSYQNSVILE
jgi:hypothetical protein